MSFCIRCGPAPCGIDGLISLQWNTSGQAQDLDADCDSISANPSEQIIGSIQGTLAVQAYAFEENATDVYLGVRCRGMAQASQQNLMRYDGITCKDYLIPSKNNSGQITGGLLGSDALSLGKIYGNVQTVETQANNGASITTTMESRIGTGLKYAGKPSECAFPDMNFYDLFGQFKGLLSGFSIEVDYPYSPARCNYTFQFTVPAEGE